MLLVEVSFLGRFPYLPLSSNILFAFAFSFAFARALDRCRFSLLLHCSFAFALAFVLLHDIFAFALAF